MRVPGGGERTGDKNVRFARGFAADRAVMRRTTAPAGATSRATTLLGTRKGYAAAPARWSRGNGGPGASW